jgi:tRNA(fMet)-specific endonuclease VapC
VSYLLDISAVIALLKNQPPIVRTRPWRAAAHGSEIAVSSIVLYELWYGVARSERRSENTERLRVFLSGNIAVLSFDKADSAIAGELRGTLQRTGTPIGPYDLLIAAQALQHAGDGERVRVRAGARLGLAELVRKGLTDVELSALMP